MNGGFDVDHGAIRDRKCGHDGSNLLPRLRSGLVRQRPHVEGEPGERRDAVRPLPRLKQRAGERPAAEHRVPARVRLHVRAEMGEQAHGDPDRVDALLGPRRMGIPPVDLDHEADHALAGGDDAEVGRLAGDAHVVAAVAGDVVRDAPERHLLVDRRDERDVGVAWQSDVPPGARA